METKSIRKIGVVHFGDTTQLIFAIPAIIGLRSKCPEANLNLFLDVDSTKLTSNFDYVDCVYRVDTAEIKKQLSTKDRSESTIELLNRSIVHQDEIFDLIINLNQDNISILATTHISSHQKLGPYLNNNGEIQIEDIWSQYASAIVGNTILNPFHQTDLYKYICQVKEEASGIDLLPSSRDILACKKLFPNEPGLKIGLTLNNQWPLVQATQFCVEALQMYPKAKIFLFPSGISEDLQKTISVSLGAELSAKNVYDRFYDCSSYQSDLSKIHALSNEMHVMVGNICLATHLAAACGTFTIGLSFLDQNLYESGTYGHGHLQIVDDNQDASELKIPAMLVIQALQFAVGINGSKTPSFEQWREFGDNIKSAVSPQFKIFYGQRTTFKDQKGCERIDFLYEPILSFGSNLQECLLSFYRLIWQFELNQSEDTIDELHLNRESTVKGLIKLVEALERLYKIADFGITYCNYINDDLKRNDVELAKQDSDRVQEIDTLIHRWAKEVPAIAPLTNFYHVNQFQSRSSSTEEAVSFAKAAYERMQIQISIVLDLIQETVHKSKLQVNRNIEKELPLNPR